MERMESTPVTGRGSVFDWRGAVTEFRFGGKQALGLFISILLTVLCAHLPLEHISPVAPKGLALIVLTIAIWFSGCLPQIVGSFILPIGCVLLGLAPYKKVLSEFGTSPFFQIAMFCIIAMGANKTNIGKRIAYFFLSRLGNSPGKILLALALSAAVLSAFVSNLATTAVMITIGNSILLALDEKPGESGFGKAMMILTPVGSMIGGLALISGSPGINLVALGALETATGGAYTVSYAQWAAIGIPFALLVVAPSMFIYSKWFRADRQLGSKTIDIKMFQKELENLGPLSWDEIRWILTILFMILTFLFIKLPMPIVACIFATITILPLVGTVSYKAATRELPMGVLFLAGVTPLMGTILTQSNIVSVLGGLFGWITDVPLIVAMFGLAFITWFLQAVLLETWAAVIVVVCAAVAPIAMENGINPALLLYPSIAILSAQMVMGITGHMLLTFRFNYFKLYDTIIPGTAVSLVWMVVVTLLTYFIGPLVGMA